MKIQIKLDIECGELTCASTPGMFCKYFYTQRFGTIDHCHLFSKMGVYGGLYEPLEVKDGWTLRHPDCLTNCKDNKDKVVFSGITEKIISNENH